jgi:uncharacterized protein
MMFHAKSDVQTTVSHQYLVQLCKHFAHKIPVHYDETHGVATFTWGECQITAHKTHLSLRCTAKDMDGLQHIQAVVADHLQRFSWRQPVQICWEIGE